jgi:vacuolar-type H+-ATPase subunit E/Vma4
MKKNTFDTIKDEIKRQADAEIESIRQAAQDELTRLKKEFDEKKSQYLEEKTMDFNKSGELKKREIITNKRVLLKKKLLNEKRQLIEEIYDGIIEGLKKLKPEKYVIFIENILKEIIITKNEEIRPGKTEKIFDDVFIKNINKKNGWKLKLGKTADISNGFLVVEENYETTVDWDTLRDFIKQKEEDRIISYLFKGAV